MKISVIQSKQRILYDVNNPGIYDYETCVRLSKESVDEGLKMTESAARNGAQLIVTIEALNIVTLPHDTRYPFLDTVEELNGQVFDRFSKLAGKYGIYIVGGLYNKRNGKAYNSGILFGPDGKIVGIYDKVHLAGGEKIGLTPGNSFPVFETNIGNIGILVCWDMQYPEAARELVLNGADVIVCPTWGWENIYGLSRAYENDIVVAAAMALPPNGIIEGLRSPSTIVHGSGSILAQGDLNRSCIVTADAELSGTKKENGQTMRQIRLSDRRPETYLKQNLRNEDI